MDEDKFSELIKDIRTFVNDKNNGFKDEIFQGKPISPSGMNGSFNMINSKDGQICLSIRHQYGPSFEEAKKLLEKQFPVKVMKNIIKGNKEKWTTVVCPIEK